MTHEEVKRAVLAECERLCPKVSDIYQFSVNIAIQGLAKKNFKKRWQLWIWSKTLVISEDTLNEDYELGTVAFQLFGLNQPPAQKVDFSPIAEDLKIVHNAMVKAYADNEFNVSELFALNAVETYLTKLEMGLVQPPADTKWERLKEKIESSRVWLEKQDKEMVDWNELDNEIKTFARLMALVEEEGELKA